MAAERLSMRTIKEVLRLKWEKAFSNKQVAQSCNIARSTVRDYVSRAEKAGLSWPLASDLDDSRLEALLFPASSDGWYPAAGGFGHGVYPSRTGPQIGDAPTSVAGVQSGQPGGISIQPILSSVPSVAR